MSQANRQTQETQQQPIIIISSSVDTETKPIKICWLTGEEKNCAACYLSKGCKAKT
ncbi:MAG: hypothetical protein NWE96_08860 [Candidatus Bathyarchaeota archaeon]|nr:hypothetical protein [Candidatus Bathyarchaeota archaeon]